MSICGGGGGGVVGSHKYDASLQTLTLGGVTYNEPIVVTHIHL